MQDKEVPGTGQPQKKKGKWGCCKDRVWGGKLGYRNLGSSRTPSPTALLYGGPKSGKKGQKIVGPSAEGQPLKKRAKVQSTEPDKPKERFSGDSFNVARKSSSRATGQVYGGGKCNCTRTGGPTAIGLQKKGCARPGKKTLREKEKGQGAGCARSTAGRNK